jgi:hypothetical protein
MPPPVDSPPYDHPPVVIIWACQHQEGELGGTASPTRLLHSDLATVVPHSATPVAQRVPPTALGGGVLSAPLTCDMDTNTGSDTSYGS